MADALTGLDLAGLRSMAEDCDASAAVFAPETVLDLVAKVERLQRDREFYIREAKTFAAERDEVRARVAVLEDALGELVTLKDGPRDEDYERRKPIAWAHTRALLDDREESP